jgi:hypothetical protein
VQLHAVQELWDLLQCEPDQEDIGDHSDTESHMNMLLSKEAMSLGDSSKSLKFLGSIQGYEVMVLIDSGSFHSFVNMKLLRCLEEASDLISPVQVQVGNGSIDQCSKVFNQAICHIHDVQFVTNLKVLPLPFYDIILGMDWLELHSPMYIDWVNKWMTVNIAGQSMQLHELQPSLPTYSLVKLCLVHNPNADNDLSCHAQ